MSKPTLPPGVIVGPPVRVSLRDVHPDWRSDEEKRDDDMREFDPELLLRIYGPGRIFGTLFMALMVLAAVIAVPTVAVLGVLFWGMR